MIDFFDWNHYQDKRPDSQNHTLIMFFRNCWMDVAGNVGLKYKKLPLFATKKPRFITGALHLF
jgi:hypothetical protein